MPRKIEETKMEKHNPEAKSSIKRHKAKTRQKREQLKYQQNKKQPGKLTGREQQKGKLRNHG